MDDRATISPSLLVTRHLQRQSVAIFPKPTCIWRSDERDRNTGALHPDRVPDGSESGDPNRPESLDTATDSASSSPTTTTADPIPAIDSQEDDPRLDVVVGLLAKRATDKAGNVKNRARYEKGAVKKITEERGDAIRHLLDLRPSASAERIVDLLEHNTAPAPLGARDPNANRKKIDRKVDECVELGVFDGIPEPVREAWVDHPAPLPPELMARARHQEDEQLEQAVAS